MNMSRYKILITVVVAIFTLLVGRLFYIQVVDGRYKSMAQLNSLKYNVLYPTRGEVFDRNGNYLVQSHEVYDFMVTYREISKKGFDTVLMCRILDISKEQLIGELNKARRTSRRPHMVMNQLPKQTKLRIDECNFEGFYTVLRTVRSYPRQICGNLMGYVGEISAEQLKSRPYYKSGDYIGISGLESAYETELRGRKGVIVSEVDAHGVMKQSYKGGIYDSLPIPGNAIVCTIDSDLQTLAEELMDGKVGSVVAIEPSTGEILMMVSSPTYDPNKLVGKQLRTNYVELYKDPRRPLYNRAVSARYPPGSTFKLVQGLIGLQEGVLTPETRYSCSMGFPLGNGRKVGCHAHASPADLRYAVATSCNAYFCYVFRNVVDNKKYATVQDGYDKWAEYVSSFGFGRKLDSDFLGETRGYVPPKELYDDRYRSHWRASTVISLSIGQGELGCTPLQMANLAAIVANRGYYYIPHIVRSVEGQDSLSSRFYEKQYTMVDSKHFEPIVEGMWNGVHVGGTSTSARVEGLDICGKTGTSQNPHGKDHSTFLCFAPKNNPKIAISVYVENGGF